MWADAPAGLLLVFWPLAYWDGAAITVAAALHRCCSTSQPCHVCQPLLLLLVLPAAMLPGPQMHAAVEPPLLLQVQGQPLLLLPCSPYSSSLPTPQRVSISAATLPTPPMPTTATCSTAMQRSGSERLTMLPKTRQCLPGGLSWCALHSNRQRVCAVHLCVHTSSSNCHPCYLLACCCCTATSLLDSICCGLVPVWCSSCCTCNRGGKRWLQTYQQARVLCVMSPHALAWVVCLALCV